MPPLRFLHQLLDLNLGKLSMLERLPTAALRGSLLPNQPGSLKAREDGAVLDGHHRLQVLIERGVDIQVLPREIIKKEPR